ncbi:chemotaxis protein CheW [Azohydromonas sediminis]|uniref:chemotaxis protein CheW n=1 Tax=Azohydromonas sediminis TaxID=2259674 RepID=UPI000E656770|nr:chemotaxis protein CheW [Azohydromonas sediminis]
MADKQALRDLQTRLAERLRSAQSQPRVRSWLAVECRGHGLLLPLDQAGEIFAPPPLLAVPHTQSWFAGVANLRGSLYTVVDLATFLGVATAPLSEAARESARVVALNARLGVNAALLIDRLAGLRSADQLVRDTADAGAQPPFAGERWRDADGRLWQEIVLAALAEDDRFLAVAA